MVECSLLGRIVGSCAETVDWSRDFCCTGSVQMTKAGPKQPSLACRPSHRFWNLNFIIRHHYSYTCTVCDQ